MVGILKWWFAGLGDVPMTYFTTKGVPWLTHCNLLVSSSSPLGTGKQATYLRSLLWNQSFYLYVFVKTLHYGYIWFFQDVASDCFFFQRSGSIFGGYFPITRRHRFCPVVQRNSCPLWRLDQVDPSWIFRLDPADGKSPSFITVPSGND